jgi:hypothetical protein
MFHNLVFSQKLETFEKLQNGDLLFQTGIGSEFENAIIHSVSDISDLYFSHCGVVFLENDSIFVLEAEPENGVIKTKFVDFYNKSTHLVVGRLNFDYQYIINESISKILSLIGKKYDFIFSDNNDEYYCSELIQKTFTDNKDIAIFETIPMTFKNINTGEINSYWVEYFKKLETTIPEGKQGSNPTNLSKSDKISIIYLLK